MSPVLPCEREVWLSRHSVAQCIFSGHWWGRAGSSGCPSGVKARKALWPGLWTEWRAPSVHNPALVSGRPWSHWARIPGKQGWWKDPACLLLAWPTPVLTAGRFSTRVLWGSRITMVQTGALSIVGKSQGGTVQGRGGFILLAPGKNWVTALSLPTNRPAIGTWKAAMAAT